MKSLSNPYVVTGLSLFYSILCFPFPLNLYDEGVMLMGAERILHGEIPYKDFWTVYSPAHFWLLAAAFKLFGSSVMVERVTGIILRALFTYITCLLATRIMRPWKAFVVCWLIVLWMNSATDYNYPIIPTLFFIEGGLLTLDTYLKQGCRWRLFATGLCGGGAVLFRYDIGGIFLLTLTLWLAFRRRPFFSKNLFQDLFTLYGGCLSMLLFPIFYFFLHKVSSRDIIKDLILFPLMVYPRVSAKPIQQIFPEDIFPLCLTFVSLSWSVYFLILQQKRKLRDGHAQIMWVILLLSGMLFLRALLRIDFPHLFGSFVLSLLVVGYAIEQWLHSPSPPSPFFKRGVLVALAGVIFFAISIHTLFIFRNLGTLYSISRKISVPPPPRAKGVFYNGPIFFFQGKAIRYIQDHVPPTEKIYVGLTRHDRLVSNDALFYFLAERMPATRYHELYPGVATDEKTQQEMVSELKRKKISYIVLLNLQPPYLPNIKGSLLLDQYLQSHYERDIVFGPYIVLKLKKI